MSIVLYTTHCPRCSVLEKKLKLKNITYEECSEIAVMKKKGVLQVPMIEVEGNLMDFSTSNKWINEQ